VNIKISTNLIPRKLLFGNQDKSIVRISPDGKRLAYLAPYEGVMNVWVGTANNLSASKPVTSSKKRGIPIYFWAYTNNHILYVQDNNGDENWNIFSMDLSSLKEKNLTPIDNVNAQIIQINSEYPDKLIIGLNDRKPEYHDLYKLNLISGKKDLIVENNEFSYFCLDNNMNPRFAIKFVETGAAEFYKLDSKYSKTERLFRVEAEDVLNTEIIGFSKDNCQYYLADSRDRDTNGLFLIDCGTGKGKCIAEHPKADIQEFSINPITKTIEAVAFDYLRREWCVLDDCVKNDFDFLTKNLEGDLFPTSRSLDNITWIVGSNIDNGPIKYYLYDRKNKQIQFLFSNRKELENCKLNRMIPVIINCRDGLEMVSYYTLPDESGYTGKKHPNEPVPLVLLVHGGPWGRDSWGLNTMHQWLANRGYAVLSVNFRGSTGFGKKFVNAANLEWGRKMHDDLIDAVKWAINNKITTKDQVAIMGGSYGGYATLAGLTFTPDTFACGVDIVGPSNLQTLLENMPPYWKPMEEVMLSRVGDYRTKEGKVHLSNCSPLTHAHKIKKPLLIGQGANDPRVLQSESDQIVKSMQDSSIPVTYIVFPDEGHGFNRPENRLSFFAITEAFLANVLGGECQPTGDDFENSSHKIICGEKEIPGL
jgi:dienelactone hydrolase